MSKAKILVIDDEPSQLELLDIFLRSKGHDVMCASTAEEGELRSGSFCPDVTLLDVNLPDGNGLELLAELSQKTPGSRVIIITAYHNMETTVRAMKLGAFEYITKPIDVDELEHAVTRTLNEHALHGRDAITLDQHLLVEGPIVGISRQMKQVFKTIGILSENRVTVLIEGETGTGKELVAKAIHGYSANRNHPFLAINCSAIVETLLESELFGHEKGSFSGAISNKKGKFELAGEGTIFLDEIGEMPLEMQAKLLRFLQEKEFTRVGGEKTLKSNARVIAATNRNISHMVKEGVFREDLYYRLGVSKIYIPPLRERREDIPQLINYVLGKISADLGKNPITLEQQAILRMKEHDWPGNVRQLENVLTQAAIASRGGAVLDNEIMSLLGKPVARGEEPNDAPLSLKEVERNHIIKILKHTKWHLAKTAHILGISRPTLRSKIREYHIGSSKRKSGFSGE